MKRFSIVLIALLTLFDAQVHSKATIIVAASKKKDLRTMAIKPDNRVLDYKDRLNVRVKNNKVVMNPAQDAANSGDQFEKPFYSNDDNVILKGVDYMYSIGTAPLANNGHLDFTYDSNGILIGYESTQKNTDNIINISEGADLYPVGATLKTVVDNDPDDYRAETYYIDPQNGERHDISIKRYKYFNDEPVLIINKELDENGKLAEYSKVESQFDDQGRPTVTFIYTPHFTEQHERYLGLYRKYEYEYLPDGMVSKTTYDFYDQNGNAYWEYLDRIISGFDSEGYYCYEKMDYDPTESTWSGNKKYRCLLSDDETQYTEINWTWDSDGNKWIPYVKAFSIYNSSDMLIYQEQYMYEPALGTFYLNSKGGYEFQDGTLLISNWSIAYDAPESLEQMSQQDALINYSRKNEYFYNKDNRVSSAAHYELNDKGQWIMFSKEATLYYASGETRNYYRFTQDIQGADTTWVIDELKNVEIDDAGHTILDESYMTWDNTINTWQSGTIQKWEYSASGKLLSEMMYSIEMGDTTCYKTLNSYDDAGRPKLISKYYQNPNETDWILYHKEEYTFDSSARTLTSKTSDLDQEGRWHIIGKSLRQLDSNGRTLLDESYTRDSDNDQWIGVKKEEFQYNEQGDTVMLALFEWDDIENDWYGTEKNCIYSNNDTIIVEMFDWDLERNDWYGLNKAEYYSDTDKEIETHYRWDYINWCWTGAEKSEIIYGSDDYNFTDIEYEWDQDKKNWTASMMYVFENEETDSYSFERTSISEWDNQASEWKKTDRGAQWQYWNNSGNLDYILTTEEKFDKNTNDWKLSYTLKDVYVYTAKTKVESCKINAEILVSDATITVRATDDSMISITSASGIPVATGRSALTAPVAPGVYLITIGSRTTRVIVR